jgi:branched-chain amino acid transport system substrate-binding protein
MSFTRTVLVALGLLSVAIVPGQAQFTDNRVKIGVLTDMSGFVSQETGQGSVEAAKMAVEKFDGKVAGIPIEVIFALLTTKTSRT